MGVSFYEAWRQSFLLGSSGKFPCMHIYSSIKTYDYIQAFKGRAPHRARKAGLVGGA